MEFKGTLGIWKAIDNGYFFDIRTSHDDYCQTLASAQENGYLGINKEIQAANALLISKAPELLEKLKQCVNMLDEIQIGESLADNIRILLVAESEQLIQEATTLPNG